MAAALADRERVARNDLVADSDVLRRTAEGRMFRLPVIASGDEEISSAVTEWQKQGRDTP